MESLESGQSDQSIRNESLSLDEDELFSMFVDISSAVDSNYLRQPGPFFGEHPPSKSKDSSSQQQNLFAPTCALDGNLSPLEDFYALENGSHRTGTLPESEYWHERFHREPIQGELVLGTVAPPALQLPQDGALIPSTRLFGAEDAQFQSTIELQSFLDQACNVTSLSPAGDPTQSQISERRRLLASLSEKGVIVKETDVTKFSSLIGPDLTEEISQWIPFEGRSIANIQRNSGHGSFQQFKIVKARPKRSIGITKNNRKGPACIICRWYKRECAGGTPCIGCADGLSRLTSHSPCIATDSNDMTLCILDANDPTWSKGIRVTFGIHEVLQRLTLKRLLDCITCPSKNQARINDDGMEIQLLLQTTYCQIESFRKNQLSRRNGTYLLQLLKLLKEFLEFIHYEDELLRHAATCENKKCFTANHPIQSFDDQDKKRICASGEEGRASGKHLYAAFQLYEQLIERRLKSKFYEEVHKSADTRDIKFCPADDRVFVFLRYPNKQLMCGAGDELSAISSHLSPFYQAIKRLIDLGLWCD